MTSSYVAIHWVDVGAWNFLETKVDGLFGTLESNFRWSEAKYAQQVVWFSTQLCP